MRRAGVGRYVICRLCPLTQPAAHAAKPAAPPSKTPPPSAGDGAAPADGPVEAGGAAEERVLTLRGTMEDGVLRTAVSWGSATPFYGLRYTAPLRVLPDESAA